MADPTPEPKQDTPESEAPEGKPEITEESLKKLIQSEVDRVRTSKSKEIKALELELESLRKEKMSAEQIKEFERKQLEERLIQKERELTDKEILIKARDLLTQEGLALSFVDFVKADTIEATEQRVKTLKAEWQKKHSEAVDSAIKSHARDPNKERTGGSGSEIAGMTPAQIQAKSKADPEWFRKNEAEIMDSLKDGKYSKK